MRRGTTLLLVVLLLVIVGAMAFQLYMSAGRR
jgi:hypothetical protein